MEYNELKQIIASKGLTMKSLAERAGMSFHGFNKALKSHRVRLDTWLKVAEILEMPLENFVNAEDAKLVKGEGHADLEKVIEDYKRQLKFYETQFEHISKLLQEKEANYQKNLTSHMELIKILTEKLKS